jgi:hypothetical protein
MPLPGKQRALRQAQLYGHLVARGGRLFYPGSSQPLGHVRLAKQMVRSGWLILRDGKYEITPEGQRATEPGELGLANGSAERFRPGES